MYIALMKNFLKTGVLALVLMFPGAAVQAVPAEAQSCRFVNAFMQGRSEALSELAQIMRVSDDDIAELTELFGSFPESMLLGHVLELGSAGNLYREHLIVLNALGQGNMYFRIIYENVNVKMVGMRLKIDSDLDVSLGHWPVLQQPVDVDCSFLTG